MKLLEISAGDYSNDAAEGIAAPAFLDEGQGFLEMLGNLGGDAAHGADVEGGAGGSGGGEADSGAKHLTEAFDLLSDLGAF